MANGFPPVRLTDKSHLKSLNCREMRAVQNGSIFAEIGNGSGRAKMGTIWDAPIPRTVEGCALEHALFTRLHLIL